MTKQEFKEKIRLLIKQVYSNRSKAEEAAVEYDELTKFPELKAVIVDLLTHEFDNFLGSIDWVYLIYNGRSWVAEIEGKSYYLLNLSEEEQATMAVARILRYGSPETEEETEETEETGGGEEVDVEVDTEETEEA